MKTKHILVGFAIFLSFMWTCTLISKSLYASKLPMVSTAKPERKYIEHLVEAEGIVEPGNKLPVTTKSGLRAASLAVQEGDRVEEGSLLFTIDMEDLQKIIETKQKDIEQLQLQINTLLHNQEIDRSRKALEEQRARDDYNAEAVRQDILVGRASEEVAQVEDEMDESEDPGSKELREALQNAAYGEADAKWNREQTMKDASRKIEDILLPEKADTALEEHRLQLKNMQEDISLYQAFLDTDGNIYSGLAGTITNICIDAGSRIPDTAVMLISDDTVPCRLRVPLTKEQKKYLKLGDNVSVKLDGSGRAIEAAVSYLAENEHAPGTYTAVIDLPEETGKPGITGTVRRSETGDLYPCCIDRSLIYRTDTKSYIYLLKERDGILGTEYYAEETVIKILDENDSLAAIEGPVTGDDQIIRSATKDFQNGDTVRIY